MYLDFYRLSIKPFQISTDPRFLWLGEKHQEALAVLKYGILDNKGFLLLTGDVGTGKTTLLNALVNSLGNDVLVAMVADPGLAKMDFFNFVADSFGMNRSFKSKGEFLISLKNYLLSLNQQGKQALLIIDECQRLNQKLLEEVRLLSNIEKADTKLINIFFVGQSEFNPIILKPQNRAIRQRITVNYNISALSETETNAYIRFRLTIAGNDESIFTAGAIKKVYEFSNGYPRLINIICDQALLTGFVKERKIIDETIVSECSEELRIEQDTSIEPTDPTPETTSDSRHRVVPSSQEGRKYKPLIVAFFVILIIWIVIVTLYLFTLNRSGAANEVENDNLPVKKQIVNTLENSAQKKDSGVAIPPDPSQYSERLKESSKSASKPTTKNAKVTQTDHGEPRPAKQNRQLAGIANQRSSDTDKISLKDISEEYGTFPEVHFDINSNKLNDAGYDVLNAVARYCIQNPEAIVILRGYTDRSGVSAYNMKLSEFRADVVRTYLVGRGVTPETITTIAIGPGDKGPGGTKVPYGDDRRKVMIEIITPTG